MPADHELGPAELQGGDHLKHLMRQVSRGPIHLEDELRLRLLVEAEEPPKVPSFIGEAVLRWDMDLRFKHNILNERI